MRSSCARQVPPRMVERHSRLCAQAEAVAGGEGLPDARLTRLAAFVEAHQEAGGMAAMPAEGPAGGTALLGKGSGRTAMLGGETAETAILGGGTTGLGAATSSCPEISLETGGHGGARGVDQGGPAGGAPGDWVALEAVVLACRSAASLQPDGTSQPASRCRARALSFPTALLLLVNPNSGPCSFHHGVAMLQLGGTQLSQQALQGVRPPMCTPVRALWHGSPIPVAGRVAAAARHWQRR